MKVLTDLMLVLACAFTLSCNKASVKSLDSLPHNHTHKLLRPLSVSFLTSKKIEIKQKTSIGASLKIYLKKEKSKRLIDEAFNVQSSTYKIKLPEDLSEFNYIVVVAEATDSNGNKMSAVDTYKIGEQDVINDAKETLKNRH